MSRRLPTVAVLVAAVLSLAGALGGCGSAATPAPRYPSSRATLTVGRRAIGPRIPAAFTGISMEIPAVVTYAGSDPGAVNPVLVQLIRNLSPQHPPVLRLGGDSTDWTWYGPADQTAPEWARYTIRASWFAVTRALIAATGAHVIVGVNFEADSRALAAAEGGAIVRELGSGSIAGLELGNEPELYPSFSWYKTPAGKHVDGRPHSYDFADYERDWANVAGALPKVPLAGPAVGGPQWSPVLPGFLHADRDLVSLATMHRYPLKKCTPSQSVTIPEVLAASSSRGLARGTARYVRDARSEGLPLRIDEMNSVSCGGEPGVSNTFASTLWALDTLFGMAAIGVDGVNVHTVPNGTDQLFAFSHSGDRWSGTVAPTYYGMLAFADAAPAGSRIVRVSGVDNDGAFRVWADRTPSATRVVLINTQAGRGELVRVRDRRGRTGSLALLNAPSLAAHGGITLGGRSFGQATQTGRLGGSSRLTRVPARRGVYRVQIPPHSAGILTIPR